MIQTNGSFATTNGRHTIAAGGDAANRNLDIGQASM